MYWLFYGFLFILTALRMFHNGLISWQTQTAVVILSFRAVSDCSHRKTMRAVKKGKRLQRWQIFNSLKIKCCLGKNTKLFKICCQLCHQHFKRGVFFLNKSDWRAATGDVSLHKNTMWTNARVGQAPLMPFRLPGTKLQSTFVLTSHRVQRWLKSYFLQINKKCQSSEIILLTSNAKTQSLKFS